MKNKQQKPEEHQSKFRNPIEMNFTRAAAIKTGVVFPYNQFHILSSNEYICVNIFEILKYIKPSQCLNLPHHTLSYIVRIQYVCANWFCFASSFYYYLFVCFYFLYLF